MPGGIYNYPLKPGTALAHKWRKVFNTKIFPSLVAFKPDFIFMSSGFDAHEHDHIHNPKDT